MNRGNSNGSRKVAQYTTRIARTLDRATFGRSSNASIDVAIGSSGGWLDHDAETTIALELTRGRPGRLLATTDLGNDRVELRVRGYSERTALLRALEIAIREIRREVVAAHRSADAARRANHEPAQEAAP